MLALPQANQSCRPTLPNRAPSPISPRILQASHPSTTPPPRCLRSHLSMPNQLAFLRRRITISSPLQHPNQLPSHSKETHHKAPNRNSTTPTPNNTTCLTPLACTDITTLILTNHRSCRCLMALMTLVTVTLTLALSNLSKESLTSPRLITRKVATLHDPESGVAMARARSPRTAPRVQTPAPLRRTLSLRQ